MRIVSISFLLVVLFTSCQNGAAAIDLNNEQQVREALAQTWEATHMETRGSRIKVPEENIDHVTFHNNGRYTTKLKDGVIEQTGNLSYDSKTKLLNLTQVENSGVERLHKLTANEMIVAGYLVLNDEIVDSTIMTYKKK
jgi:transcription antitermination factor NusG